MNAESPHILVVDDDDRLRALLARYLAENGFLVATAADAAEATARLAAVTFDLIILDLMMPGESGLQLAQRLRRRSDVPILMLTAMAEPEDRIAGLERGADDYVVKPFEPRELVLRIGNILKRTPPVREKSSRLRLGLVEFDCERGELWRNEMSVRLTSVEAALLRVLASRPGVAFGRDELIALTGASGGDRAVDVQVTRLRRKIERDPRDPRYLLTLRGKGYALMPD